MPWKTELPMEQREKFVILVQSDRYTKKELCEQFGISRKTGHKWLKRYVEEGKRGDTIQTTKGNAERTAELLREKIRSGELSNENGLQEEIRCKSYFLLAAPPDPILFQPIP